jgi:hypothetical protein
MTLNPYECAKVSVACALFVAITLAWVHLSHQTRVSRSHRHSIGIAVRWIYIFAVGFLVFCFWFGVMAEILIAVMTLLLVHMPLTSMKNEHIPLADFGPVGLAVGMALFIPVFLLKQYILGFPDYDQIVLSPPRRVPTPKRAVEMEMPELDQQLATVVATLKPIGKIECNGRRIEAASFDGNMLDIGQLVQICGYRNRIYVVRPSDESDVAS